MKKFGRRIYVAALAAVLAFSLVGCGKKNQEEPTTAAVTTQAESTEEQTSEEKTEAAKEEQSSADFVFTLKGNGNRWENNGKICEQFDGVIKNQTGQGASDWKIELDVPDGSVLENGWNGTYAISGTKLTITAVDYNREVPGNGEITLGFILETPSVYEPAGKLLLPGNTYAANDTTASATVASNDKKEDESDGKEEKKEEKKDKAPKDTSGTPVANHGALSVKGTDIVDKNGKLFQLKGVSTHGLAWFPEYVNKEAFESLASYGVNAIRLAMYTDENGGYCVGGNREQLKKVIDDGVKACDELGMYVIIDWHILHDLDPNKYIEDSKQFFEEITKKYADHDNVIYEICNEPNGGTTWESVKSYAETIIPIIRANDKKAMIIVGTPTWSQDVDIASTNPITGQENILYAVHFYASTHKQQIRDKVETARGNGIAVIVSECSICEASGNGSIDYNEAEAWSELIKKDNLSFFAWNLSNKDEQSSLLKPSVSKKSGFTDEDFSDTGKWFMELCGKY